MTSGTARDVYDALRAIHGTDNVLDGSGGCFVRGHGWVTLAQARKLTGIPAPKRARPQRVTAYGDWATVAQINGVRP